MAADRWSADPAYPRRIHVVGIGGAGMSAIATVLATMGHRLSGSDLRASPVTDRLVASGIPVAIGHSADNVAGADVVTSSPAITADNPELVEARRRGIVVLTRAEALAGVAALKRLHRRGRDPREDDHRLDAGSHPGRGRDGRRRSSSAATSTGSGPTRCGTTASGWWSRRTRATGASSSLRAGDRRGHQRRAGPPRPLRRLRRASATPSAVLVPRARPAGGGRRRRGGRGSGGRTAPTGGHGRRLHLPSWPTSRRPAARWPSTSSAPTGRSGRARGAGARRSTTPATPRWPRWRRSPPGCPVGRGRRPWPASPAWPAASSSGATSHGVTFVDDYAHLPGEVRAVLAATKSGGWRRVVAVFQPHRFTPDGRALAANSARRSPTPTWWWSPTSTRPASPRSPACPVSWWPTRSRRSFPDKPVALRRRSRAELVRFVPELLAAGRPLSHLRGGRPHLAARRAPGRARGVTAVTSATTPLDGLARALGGLAAPRPAARCPSPPTGSGVRLPSSSTARTRRSFWPWLAPTVGPARRARARRRARLQPARGRRRLPGAGRRPRDRVRADHRRWGPTVVGRSAP